MNRDQEYRALLAVLLSLGIYWIWVAWFAPKPPPAGARPTPMTAPASPTQAPGEARPEVPSSSAGTSSSSGQPVRTAPERVAEEVPEREVPIESEGWSGKVSWRDGAVTALESTEYTHPPKVQPLWSWVFEKVTGRSPSGWRPYEGGEQPQQLLDQRGALVLAGTGKPAAQVHYRVEKQGEVVVATGHLPNGVVVTKHYSKGARPYTLDVEVTFRNAGTEPVRPWVGVVDDLPESSGRFANTLRPTALVDDSVEELSELSKLDDQPSYTGPVSWFGLGDRYFVAVLLPAESTTGTVKYQALPDGRGGAFLEEQPLDPGASRTVRFTAFVGPKRLEVLNELGQGLDKAVDLGWFGFFARILLFFLKIFHKGVGNWGVSIILLTVAVKLVFFPLTHKAFASSRKMQALQPRLQEIKEKYKDNKEIQTRETMKVFTENKVNPMGGCLPTLIQLPVWFALYRVMYGTVELYNSSFLYLRDLTALDPYGILPTLYAVLMILQQRMIPMGGMDPTQAKIMRIMPLVFAFFMYGFPSGLVLYFCVNIGLSIFQQWLINRSFEKKEPVLA